jgi:hypothetical protein
MGTLFQLEPFDDEFMGQEYMNNVDYGDSF